MERVHNGLVGRRRRLVVLAAVAAATAAALPACSGRSPHAKAASQRPPATSSPAPTVPVPEAAPTTSLPTSAASGFEPVSVTYVSERTGWVLGRTPCPGEACRAALLATADAGATWSPLTTPVPVSTDATALARRHVRFANIHDGWVYGPDLLATHDGGAHWAKVDLPGVGADSNVAALEASGGQVHAAVMDANAGDISIMSSPVDRDAWRRSSTRVEVGAGPVPVTQLVLHGRAGWLVEVDRTVIGGAELRNGDWVPWTPPCTRAGGGAEMAAASNTVLAAMCDEGTWFGPNNGPHLYLSSNGGASFRRAPTQLPSGTGLAMASPGTLVMVGGGGLLESVDNGVRWHTVFDDKRPLAYTDLGFTTPQRGVVIEFDINTLHDGRLLQTSDGGNTWHTIDLDRRPR